MYSRIVQTIYAEKELLLGNVAVFIVVAAVFFAIAVIVVSGVTILKIGINKALKNGIFTVDDVLILGVAVIYLVFGIVLEVGLVWLTIRVLEKWTPGGMIFEELGKRPCHRCH